MSLKKIKNPVAGQVTENMMLRIGEPTQKADEWSAAISTKVGPGSLIQVLFNPGNHDEYSTWISASEIRLAWHPAKGIDLHELCHRKEKKWN